MSDDEEAKGVKAIIYPQSLARAGWRNMSGVEKIVTMGAYYMLHPNPER